MLLTIAAAAIAARLQADLQWIATLPGEPSIVSAAGVAADDQPVLTLENRSALDPADTRRRVVIVGARSDDEATETAVLDLVRWIKTEAPPALRDAWMASALPAATLDDASLTRWLAFQAADMVFQVTPTTRRPVADALLDALRSAKPGRSPARDALLARVRRDPLEVATLLASRYPETPSISYIPALAWSSALRLATVANAAALRQRVEQQTAPWRVDHKDLFGSRIQLTSVAGTLIFADLAHAGDAPSRPLAVQGADAASLVKAGDVYEYGQGWTDDMFMATVVLARTAKFAGRDRDLDLAARMLVAYATRLQRPDGIFIHATNGPVAWGRGNGFAAFGLIEALTALPTDHPSRAALLDIYRRQMRALRDQQAPDGMWREVIDEPGSYREETATAMLMTATARGIRLGWLDASYLAPVERAWRGLLAHIAADGGVIDVCTSTGAGPTKRYYLDRAAITGGDDRGGAMALVAAMELYELRHSPAVPAQ